MTGVDFVLLYSLSKEHRKMVDFKFIVMDGKKVEAI